MREEHGTFHAEGIEGIKALAGKQCIVKFEVKNKEKHTVCPMQMFYS